MSDKIKLRVDLTSKEDISNKSSSISTDTGSTTKYPTVKAVEDYVSLQVSEDYGTFTELQALIDETTSSSLTLDKDYKCQTGESPIYVSNISMFNGDGHIIDCNHITGIQFTTGTQIYNTKFINGHSEANGGGVYAFNSMIINDCIFSNNIAESNGGALEFESDGSIITNCIFYKNRAYGDGGAIYAPSDGHIIRNCLFVENESSGGAIYLAQYDNSTRIEDCVFINGGVHSSTENFEIYNCVYNEDAIYNSFYNTTNVEYLKQHQSLKTINSQSLIGSGNIDVSPTIDSDWVNNSTNPVQSKVIKTALDNKLDKTHTSYKGKNVVTNASTGAIEFEEKNNHTHSQYLTEHQSLSNYVTTSDSRLSDARTPLSHSHGNLQNNGQVGSTAQANKNVVTNSSGLITTEDKPTIPSASSTTPSADTTNGSVGTGTTWARSNHTHPKSSLYAEASHTHSQYLTQHQSLKTINNETITGTGNITIDIDEEIEYIELSVDEDVSEYAYVDTIELYGTSTKDIIDNTTTNAKFLFKMPSISDELGSLPLYIRLHYNNGNSYRTGMINNGNSAYMFDDAEKLSNAYVLVLLSEYSNSLMFFDIISKSNYAEVNHTQSLDTLRFGNDFDSGWENISLFTQDNDNKSVDMGRLITLDYSNNEAKATYNRNLEDYSKDYYEIATIDDIGYTIREKIGEYVSAVALSNDYNDLNNLPQLGDLAFVDDVDLSGHDLDELSDNTNLLFSGDYDDLTNKPTIPTATSDLSNDGDGTNPFLTEHQSLTNYLQKSDVKNNLTSTDTNKPLSAKQGNTLKSIVDTKQDIIKSITVTNDGKLYLLTQAPRYITYSNTKSMLAYENDYADISIIVNDENWEIIEGAEVQFYIIFGDGSRSPTRYLYTDNTGTCTTRVFSEELFVPYNKINIKYGEYTSRYDMGREPNIIIDDLDIPL